ncbi:hypothetical protein [Actinomadura roseirufa]|uniref:hypothetical protein n=1 Tax=Actinomadura roseirufa TaxID=2094049 RepID=UPI0010412935|nr:hypothetical protein [Actinomadura roseirufa]
MVHAVPELPAEKSKARLVDEFPGWNFINTDTGRWWAIREPKAGRRSNVVTELATDTADELAELLREADAVEAGR